MRSAGRDTQAPKEQKRRATPAARCWCGCWPRAAASLPPVPTLDGMKEPRPIDPAARLRKLGVVAERH